MLSELKVVLLITFVGGKKLARTFYAKYCSGEHPKNDPSIPVSFLEDGHISKIAWLVSYTSTPSYVTARILLL